MLLIEGYLVAFLIPKLGQKGVKRGSKGGQMGVKSQFCSNLHQIWWEGASLQAIKESFNFLTLSPPI